MEALIRLGAALLMLAIMLSWECLRPRRQLQYRRIQRWPINFGLAALNTLLIRISVGAIAYQTALSASTQHWGLLQWLTMPHWLHIGISLLLLDFAIYLQHIAAHKWSWLWRLHQVHHTDLDFDASTAVRFHPLEIALSMAYKVGCIYLLGAEPQAVIAFEIILNACATFNHSNVDIPQTIDKKLRWLLITPDMHRIHHSSRPDETDSNYGFSISLWDRLCNTYTAHPHQAQTSLQLGLKGFRNAVELGFTKLLLLPFRHLRNR